MTIITRALGVAAAAACAGLMAPAVASASPVDDAFLSYLAEQGITYSSAEFVTSTAQNVCDFIDDGNNYVDIVDELSRYPDQIALADTPVFTAAAVASYCPRNLFVIPD